MPPTEVPPTEVPPPRGLGWAGLGGHSASGLRITGEMIPLGKFRGNPAAPILSVRGAEVALKGTHGVKNPKKQLLPQAAGNLRVKHKGRSAI